MRARWLVVSEMVAVGAGATVPPGASATAIKEFPLASTSDPGGITAGPDRNLWFTDGGTPIAIGRTTPAGTIKNFTQGFTRTGKPTDITLGPDGNLWFTATVSPPNAVGKSTPAGQITEFVARVAPG